MNMSSRVFKYLIKSKSFVFAKNLKDKSHQIYFEYES